MEEVFLIDELFQEISDYPKDGDYIEKFLFYRENAYGIDIDVCQRNIDIYLKNDGYLKEKAGNVKVEKQHRSKNKYEAIVDGITFRGETLINCMQLILQIVNYERKEVIWAKDVDSIRKERTETQIIDRKLLADFVYWCYNPGNFIAIPFCPGASLNCAKGNLKERGYNRLLTDSGYTYLKVLKEYFVDGVAEVSLTKRIDSVEEYRCWKERYRIDKNGYNNFIKDHQLEAFYNNGELCISFEMTEEGFKSDVEKYMRKVIDALKARTKALKV